ncbi:MAG TPA: hypothetical protein VGP93_21265, partial [Polyangiaceae bacterium]|nr:hypothetical protein [Polyangiaceae bacterium]
MSRRALQKSVRLFRAFSEQTLRKSGPSQLGQDGVRALAALEEVLAGKRVLDGSLLQPLAAFSGLLARGKLPFEFRRSNFGDALLAVEEARVTSAAPRWDFVPSFSERTAERLGFDALPQGIDQIERGNRAGWQAHAEENKRFILAAAEQASPAGYAVVVGAARAYDLPLAEIAARFPRLILTDLSLQAMEETVRQHVPEALRERVTLERYDLTGSSEQFVRELDAAVAGAKSLALAERALLELCTSYDTPASLARLCSAPDAASFAVSSMVLSQLGVGYKAYAARCFRERGWDEQRALQAPLEPALSLLGCYVEQHHVQALLDQAALAVLTSDVNASDVRALADGTVEPQGEPLEQLSVERLHER